MFRGVKIIKNHNSDKVVFRIDNNRNFQEFFVPKGFNNFPENNPDLTKKTFFYLYGCYRNYIEESKIESDSRDKTKSSSEIEDTVEDTNGEYRFTNGATNTNLSFQKLIMFDSIIDAYEELQIFSLQTKISRTEEIDYSQIHKYYEKGIFLENHAVYVNEMNLPKQVLKNASTELIEMFCYIYSEIMNEMGREVPNDIVLALGNNFKENRLFEDSSLFAEDTYEETILILKDVLNEISTFTVYKDFDYWHFFEAIENFLYADNDGEWRIDNFSFIWERMCLNYEKTFFEKGIVLYDDFGIIKISDQYKHLINKSAFAISFNNEAYKRYLRPDLIYRSSYTKFGYNYVVVDFKYFEELRLKKIDEDLKMAITKQYAYEFALQANYGSYTISEFWIPSILNQDKIFEISFLNSDFHKKFKIRVLKYDILKLLKLYSEKNVE